ncbi:MAG: radical SAM protein [candidate division WOR-3 bacterium]
MEVGARANVLTAGCRLNQAESDALRARLIQLGFGLVGDVRTADFCFVNTCTVTAAADRSSIQLIRRACQPVPRPRVVVLGCLAERAPARVWSIPGVAEVWDNARKQAEIACVCPEPRRSRAFLKVQDGCNRECGYCVVGRLRGRPVSVPTKVVCHQFEQLLARGFQEVVLTGLNLGLYQDDDGTDLAGLVRMMFVQAGRRPVRIRLGSLEPDTVSRAILDLVSDQRMAPHFHLALQSGDDGVLARMERRYDSQAFAALVAELRRVRPDANIGFDVIVGLPAESEVSFSRTVALIDRLAPGYLHVFSYSARPGTPAAGMADVPAAGERRARARLLRERSVRFRQEYSSRFVGTVRSAVVESCATALTDNYLRVALDPLSATEPRRMVDMMIVLESGRLVGQPVTGRPSHDCAGAVGYSKTNTVKEVA